MPPPQAQQIASPAQSPATRSSQRKPVDPVEWSFDRAASLFSSSSAPLAGTPGQCLQEAISDCVEHQLSDPLLFIYHHLRHFKMVLCGNDVSPLSQPTSRSGTAPETPTTLSGSKYFDRLHRHVFQHEGGRAMRTCFFIFEHFNFCEVHESGTSDDSDATQLRSKASRQLALKAALHSSFTDLFFVSQRIDQLSGFVSGPASSSCSTLPANELSRIPLRVALAFYFAVLEEHLLAVGSSEVLLHCVICLLRWACEHSSDPWNNTAQAASSLVVIEQWVESGVCANAASAVLRSVVKLLEDLLRCGPTTIVTAPTRKKKDALNAVSVPSATSSIMPSHTRPLDGVRQLLTAAEEQQRDALLRVLEFVCGGQATSSSCLPSSPVKGVNSAASGFPRHTMVDLQTFEATLKVVKNMISLHEEVALPMFALIASRCSLLSSATPGMTSVPLDQALCALSNNLQNQTWVRLFERCGSFAPKRMQVITIRDQVLDCLKGKANAAVKENKVAPFSVSTLSNALIAATFSTVQS